MPHNPRPDSDFRHYATTRQKVLRRIAELRAYLPQLQAVVAAMPASNDDAGYLDLDNAQQLAVDLEEAVGLLVDWDTVHAAGKENCLKNGLPAAKLAAPCRTTATNYQLSIINFEPNGIEPRLMV